MGKDEFKPKHTIRDYSKFQDDRDKLGNLVLQGMKNIWRHRC